MSFLFWKKRLHTWYVDTPCALTIDVWHISLSIRALHTYVQESMLFDVLMLSGIRCATMSACYVQEVVKLDY